MHSYMLSGGNSQSFVKGSVVTKRRPGRPPKIPSIGGVTSPSVSCVSGLPVIPAPVMIGAVPMVVTVDEVDGGTPPERCPGGPPTLHTVVAEAELGAGAEAVSVGRRLGGHLRITMEYLELELEKGGQCWVREEGGVWLWRLLYCLHYGEIAMVWSGVVEGHTRLGQ